MAFGVTEQSTAGCLQAPLMFQKEPETTYPAQLLEHTPGHCGCGGAGAGGTGAGGGGGVTWGGGVAAGGGATGRVGLSVGSDGGGGAVRGEGVGFGVEVTIATRGAAVEVDVGVSAGRVVDVVAVGVGAFTGSPSTVLPQAVRRSASALTRTIGWFFT